MKKGLKIYRQFSEQLALLTESVVYLREKADNDIQSKLLEVTYSVMDGLDTKNQAVRSLWLHMRTKIEFVVANYNEVKSYHKKNKNFSIINNENFTNSLLGSGSAELQSYYQYFPESFHSKIDDINRECYEEFKANITFDLANTPENDVLSVFKTSVVEMVRKNVSRIVNLYKRTEFEIDDPQHIASASPPKKKKKNSIKTLIAENKLQDALENLLIHPNQTDENKDFIILTMGRYRKWQKDTLAGIEPSENQNEIRNTILQIANETN